MTFDCFHLKKNGQHSPNIGKQPCKNDWYEKLYDVSGKNFIKKTKEKNIFSIDWSQYVGIFS